MGWPGMLHLRCMDTGREGIRLCTVSMGRPQEMNTTVLMKEIMPAVCLRC